MRGPGHALFGKAGFSHVFITLWLQERGVEWLISSRACDLGLLSRESCLDLVIMPFIMSSHKAGGVCAVSQVTGRGCSSHFMNGKRLLSPTGG